MMCQVIEDLYIGCDSCAGNALVVDAALSNDQLAAIVAGCDECNRKGRVVVDIDEEQGGRRVTFETVRSCPRCNGDMDFEEPRGAKQCGSCIEWTEAEWAQHRLDSYAHRDWERYCRECHRWVPLAAWVESEFQCYQCALFERIDDELLESEFLLKEALALRDKLAESDHKRKKTQALRRKVKAQDGRFREKKPRTSKA